jgi:uncharacterized protein (DUF1330 family)
MTTTVKSALAAAATLTAFATLGTAETSAHSQEKPIEAGEPTTVKSLTVELKRGEVLQVVAPQGRADGTEARQKYYRTVFPLAQAQGYRRLGQLNVTRTVISPYKPGAFAFFAWPSQAAADAFASHPQWPALKATRPEAWSELKIYDDLVEEDLSLTFRTDKHYSVVVAWFDPEHPGDYERYLSGIEGAVARSGGRFMLKLRKPSIEVMTDAKAAAPGQMTLVEWDTLDGFEKVQKTPEYAASRKYFGSGLTAFEFYWLTLPG